MRRVAAAVASCVLMACGSADTPSASSIMGPSLSSAAGAGAVVQSARGAAHRWTGGEIFLLSFGANKFADGSVSGRFHVDAKSLNARLDVRVTCLSVEGNRAWVGGIIETSSNPLVQPGLSSYFYVIDVGEGSIGAIQEDIVSALRLNDAPGAELTFCADRPLTLPSRRIEDGNIQVHD